MSKTITLQGMTLDASNIWCTIIAYEVSITTKVSVNIYEIGIKGQCQIYILSIVQLVT